MSYAVKTVEPSNVINAQPVQPNVYPYAVTASTISAEPIRAVQNAHAHHEEFSQRPAPNRWRDSICDWPANMYPSCYCVCCCCYGMYLVAQMSQKVGCASFSTVLYCTLAVWILAIVLSLTIQSSAVLYIPAIFSSIWAIALRLHIAKRDQITECGALGEFCCGFWCWYCSVAQMARHVYGYSKVYDGDGDPNRPDNYGPVYQQV